MPPYILMASFFSTSKHYSPFLLQPRGTLICFRLVHENPWTVRSMRACLRERSQDILLVCSAQPRSQPQEMNAAAPHARGASSQTCFVYCISAEGDLGSLKFAILSACRFTCVIGAPGSEEVSNRSLWEGLLHVHELACGPI